MLFGRKLTKCLLLSTVLSATLSASLTQGQAAGTPPHSPTAGADQPKNQEKKGMQVLLWPQGAPGALGTAEDDKPSLTVYLPGANPTGTGVIVAPGGGYTHLAMEKEGSDIAAWLNARGIAAFVLKYRLGPKYHNPIEAGDARRAIRLVRSRAAEWGVNAGHLGMWGFSAGGHLTAIAGTQSDSGDSASADLIERQPSRPDFLVLAYPVISLEGPMTHMGSRKYLLGENPDPALEHSLSAQYSVTKQTPPAFLYATTDDNVVPVENSVLFYTAMVKAGVPVEMHLFAHGPHGTGLAAKIPELSGWPDLLLKWMQSRGYAAPGVAQ